MEDIPSSGSKMKKERWVLVLLLATAMLLRLGLGLVNRDANDNHVEVVSLIVDTHKLPEKHVCWSCYQPKLYYLVCAGVVSLLNVKENSVRILTMQLVNVFISFFVLILFWKFIDAQSLSTRSKYVLFVFFAFNPCLIGINVQSTNDTLAIFCGVLAVYACDAFFQRKKMIWAVVLLAALLAGALTKASILVLTGAIGIAFLIRICVQPGLKSKAKAAGYFLLPGLFFITIVLFAGEYYNNYTKYKNLTISTWEKDPPAAFFKRTFIGRPGIESLWRGFFTFRLLDMTRQPYINNEKTHYPAHRTSLWSQLYGRTMFMRFDQWPMSWQSRAPNIVIIGRPLIILGLVPLAFFLSGLFRNSVGFLKHLVKMEGAYLADPQNYFYLIVTLAFLAASVFYTYNYRDFSSMKSIYIFPGLLAFIKMFVDGFALLKSRRILLLVELVLAVIVLLSIADVLFLTKQLAHW